jgi:hypothetical protein
MLLGWVGYASAVGPQEPVDLALREPNGAPWPPSSKQGWTPWPTYGDVGESHDGRTIFDVNATGINMAIVCTAQGAHTMFGLSTDPCNTDPICNSWVRAEMDLGSPDSDGHLVLWGEGLLAGDYRLLTYHNRTDLAGPNNPVMPKVFVETYCAANNQARYGRDSIDNVSAPLDDDCLGVIPTANDVDVAIGQQTSDANLVPSVVEFFIAEDSTPVHIVYEAPPVAAAVMNAFVIQFPVPPCCLPPPHPLPGARGVALDVELSWSAGPYAAHCDVYFGTDFNDVNDASTSQTLGVYMGRQPANDTKYDPCGLLEFSRTYYWRIDHVNDACAPYLWNGDLWSFRTQGLIIDPNLLLWYKFDETDGNVAADSSGYENHGVIDGQTNWDPNDGRFDWCLVFDDDTAVIVPTDVLSNIGDEITIAVWLKEAYRSNSDNWVYDAGDGDFRVQAAVVEEATSHVLWRAGNDTNDVLRWDLDGIDPSTLEDWHHWAFIKDQNQDRMRIYFDGLLVAAKDAVDTTLVNVRNAPFKVGAVTYQDNDFVGKMDDFRVLDIALAPWPPWPPPPITCAWYPRPYNGQTDVQPDVNLTWRPGDYTVEHHVFLGTSWDDVNGMTDPCAVKSLGDETYDPGPLELDTTYYWRVDQVNEPNVYRCHIWQFTTANHIVVDDFESYDRQSDKIYDTWLDGGWNWTGSFVDLGKIPISPAHGGEQSMLYIYDNTVKWDLYHYWSEAELPFDSPQDWTDAGVKVLTLYFYGHPDNDTNATEELYVALGGSYAEVTYSQAGGDMNDLKRQEWAEWNIRISDFSGVDPCAVTSLFIGFGDRDNTDAVGGLGIVYFDDIRLYPPRCVPQLAKPLADFTDDCVVDNKDLRIMAQQWLRTDWCGPPPPPPDPPVGWWRLDEGSGNMAADSSANNNHGSIEGTYWWILGRIGPHALAFDEGKVQVPDDGNTPELRPADQISASAWINYSETHDHSARVVVKGLDTDDRENFGLQVTEGDELSWFLRDANSTLHSAESLEEIWHDEWVHIAGTYDGNTMECYINGWLSNANAIGAVTLLQDSNALAIGDAVDVYRAFIGKVDDVRVYDYGLSGPEVAYLATEGTGYVLLTSQVNLYDEEPSCWKVISFKDYSVLASMWLEQKLWPAQD